jgi:protocatechuate 3,4-dioxygenase alpha subunit
MRLHGVVYDGAGRPIPDALVEIRQADSAGDVPVVEGSLARGGRFTGWGRAATDAVGRYAFTTVEPAPTTERGAAFFSVAVFARGLMNRLFTRAYLPGEIDPLLQRLPPARRETLIAVRDDDGLRFDIHLQGDWETVFLSFPGHGDR